MADPQASCRQVLRPVEDQWGASFGSRLAGLEEEGAKSTLCISPRARDDLQFASGVVS